MGSDRLFQRATEEGAEHPAEVRHPHLLRGFCGNVDKFSRLDAVLEMTFPFQNTENGSHGCSCGIVGHFPQNLRGGGRAARIDDVHNLTLPAAQMDQFFHEVKILTYELW